MYNSWVALCSVQCVTESWNGECGNGTNNVSSVCLAGQPWCGVCCGRDLTVRPLYRLYACSSDCLCASIHCAICMHGHILLLVCQHSLCHLCMSHLIACVPAFTVLSVCRSHLIACVPPFTMLSVCTSHLIACVPPFTMLSVCRSHLIACVPPFTMLSVCRSHLIACVPAFIVPSMHVTSDCLCASIHYAFCTHTTSDYLCASIHYAFCTHATSDYLCASIHCAICMHVTSDGLCTSIHRAGCIHVHLIACVPTPAVPFVCVLHMIVCQHSLLCCSNYLIGIVVAVNCITASVVFLRTLEVLTPWISPFLVTEVMC